MKIFKEQYIGLSKKSRRLYINIKYKNGDFFWKALYHLCYSVE